MSNPPAFNDPDKMTSRFWGFDAADAGRVHTNSGVSNKAFFLLVDGQTFNTFTVSPIGLEKAIRVFYEAQTNILTSGADYGALANALRQACTNLTGTSGIVAADCTQVNNAVLATEMDTEAAAPDTQIDSGPGPHRRPDPDLDVQRPGAVRRPAQHREAGGELPVLDRPGDPELGAVLGRRQPHASCAACRRQLHVPGSRQHRLEHRSDPGHAGLHRLHRRHGAGLEADGQDPAFAGETLTYTITARNNGPGRPRTPGSWTSCRRDELTRARSRAPTLRDADLRARTLADDEARTFTITV